MKPREKGKDTSKRGQESLTISEMRDAKFPGHLRDWKVRAVCEPCNNGWMRELENVSAPILIPLIKGEERRISPLEQATIAAWACLKATVGVYDPYSCNKTLIHYKQLRYLKAYSRAPENGWSIWIGHYERRNWIPEWVSRPIFFKGKTRPKLKGGKPTYYDTFSVTQVIGKLLICVIHAPSPRLIKGWRFATPNNGSLFRIWPTSEISVKWPGRPLSDLDADYAADALVRSVKAVQREAAKSAPS